MVIPVRSSLLRAIVLMLGISPLWGFAADQREMPDSELESYGPIVATDTLAEIALKIKGDSPWHYQRWMYSLYQKNPKAFFGDNMNNLKLGAILKVPTEEELEQVNLAEAFRAVKVHLYVLEQGRQEKRESDDELLVRARLQRLFVSNENMQKESSELFDRISALEQQMGSVVDRVLESEKGMGRGVSPPPEQQNLVENHPPKVDLVPTPVDEVENENSAGWWFIFLGVGIIYIAAFLWRRRVEEVL